MRMQKVAKIPNEISHAEASAFGAPDFVSCMLWVANSWDHAATGV
jgi:hypothetical protein